MKDGLNGKALLASLFTVLAVGGSAPSSEYETLRAALYDRLMATPGQDGKSASCGAHHIAERQLKANDIIERLRRGRPDQDVSATQRQIDELMPGEVLAIMIACNKGYRQPPSLIFNIEPA